MIKTKMDQNSVFNAKFVIDGLAMDSTPLQLLEECSPYPSGGDDSYEQVAPIVDETLDPTPSPFLFQKDAIDSYIKKINSGNGVFPVIYPKFGARRSIASALTDCIWNKGHFGLSDIDIVINWKWNSNVMGNMAGFYSCVEEAARYACDLGIKISDVSYLESKSCCMLCDPDADELNNSGPELADDDAEIWMDDKRLCPGEAVNDKDSWIVFIPFDTCSFRLGGSALSAIVGNEKDSAPDIHDPDYFMDCFEVVREMVEDRIILSGVAVERGGLVCAAAKLCEKTGLNLDITGICNAYAEDSTPRVLFGEIPGVLIQVSDNDYDYLDSQCLLQDIAYYTLGHPVGKASELNIKKNIKPQVSSILESLIASRDTSEGED